MIKTKKLKDLENKVFEMEARIGFMELSLNNLMLSQGMLTSLDADKWYKEISQ